MDYDQHHHQHHEHYQHQGHLWGAFAIPSEAENIFSNLQSRRYLHLIFTNVCDEMLTRMMALVNEDDDW